MFFLSALQAEIGWRLLFIRGVSPGFGVAAFQAKK